MHRFYLVDGNEISSIEELTKQLRTMDDDIFNHHANDERNDFSSWIKHVFKRIELAKKIEKLNKKEMQKELNKFLKENGEKILVLNAGSSSLKFELIDVKNDKVLAKGNVDGINLNTCKIIYKINGEEKKENTRVKNHDEAIQEVLAIIKEIIHITEIDAIGHRLVHGGENLKKATLVDNEVIRIIDELSVLAPLHNPHNLAGIFACQKLLPGIKQVVVPDTAFHSTMEPKSFRYAIPKEYYDKYKIRKYGFHGTSHKYVSEQAEKTAKKKLPKIITCHLGNGDSITAIKNKKSIDTSMGLTPLQGLIMGTRSGDIDAEIVAFLSEKEKISSREVITILNKKSGLKGLCNESDMRTIHEKIKAKDKKIAYDMTVHRLTHYIGGYTALLNGVDAIIFTAGIGEGADYLRESVCKNLDYLGVRINKNKNKKHEKIISAKNSKVLIMVIPTNEELEIAKQTQKIIKK